MTVSVVTLGSIWNTTAGNKTVTATPRVGDLIVVMDAHSNTTPPPGTSTVTDNNSAGTYTVIQAIGEGAAGNQLHMQVRTTRITAASSTIFTSALSSTGGGLIVFAVRGTNPTSGATAVRQSATQPLGVAGNTPTVTLTNPPLKDNVLFGFVMNETNSTTNTAPPIGWTEAADLGYTTPPTGAEACFSITTGGALVGSIPKTITWSATSASTFAAIVIELDAPREDPEDIYLFPTPEWDPALELAPPLVPIGGPSVFAATNFVSSIGWQGEIEAIDEALAFPQVDDNNYIQQSTSGGTNSFTVGFSIPSQRVNRVTVYRRDRPQDVGTSQVFLLDGGTQIGAGRQFAAGANPLTLFDRADVFHIPETDASRLRVQFTGFSDTSNRVRVYALFILIEYDETQFVFPSPEWDPARELTFPQPTGGPSSFAPTQFISGGGWAGPPGWIGEIESIDEALATPQVNDSDYLEQPAHPGAPLSSNFTVDFSIPSQRVNRVTVYWRDRPQNFGQSQVFLLDGTTQIATGTLYDATAGDTLTVFDRAQVFHIPETDASHLRVKYQGLSVALKTLRVYGLWILIEYDETQFLFPTPEWDPALEFPLPTLPVPYYDDFPTPEWDPGRELATFPPPPIGGPSFFAPTYFLSSTGWIGEIESIDEALATPQVNDSDYLTQFEPGTNDFTVGFSIPSQPVNRVTVFWRDKPEAIGSSKVFLFNGATQIATGGAPLALGGVTYNRAEIFHVAEFDASNLRVKYQGTSADIPTVQVYALWIRIEYDATFRYPTPEWDPAGELAPPLRPIGGPSVFAPTNFVSDVGWTNDINAINEALALSQVNDSTFIKATGDVFPQSFTVGFSIPSQLVNRVTVYRRDKAHVLGGAQVTLFDGTTQIGTGVQEFYINEAIFNRVDIFNIKEVNASNLRVKYTNPTDDSHNAEVYALWILIEYDETQFVFPTPEWDPASEFPVTVVTQQFIMWIT